MGLGQWEFNVAPFREPRGFIKVLQVLFAICAFATTAGFTTTTGFLLTCPKTNSTLPLVITVEYPFDVEEYHVSKVDKTCATPNKTINPDAKDEFEITWYGNAKSDAEYYVFTGVVSFLYALLAIPVYLFYEKMYQEDQRFPMADFCITVLLAIFWVSSVAAWIKGAFSLSDATSPANIFLANVVHTQRTSQRDFPDFRPINPSFNGIVVSILFGVINFILWTGNLWFLYKETTWFESIIKRGMTRTGTSDGISSGNSI